MGQLQERITSTSKGFGHLGAGDLPCPPTTSPTRPGEHLCPPRLHHGALTGTGRAGDLPGGRSTRLHLSRPRPGHGQRRALPDRHTRTGDPAALQGPARHHRDPRHRGALRRGPPDGRAGTQGAAIPLAALPRRRGLHRNAGRVTSSSRTQSAGLWRSSTASTTSCPSRRSTWSGRSTARSSAASSWRPRRCPEAASGSTSRW